MKGERKTKAQLIDELAAAHRRIAELERSAAEEKGVEELLRDRDLLSGQLHLLQQLLDGIPIQVFYKDTQGRYLGCNASFEKFIGLMRNQLIGKTVYDIAPHNLAEIYHAADADLFDHPGVQVYETSVLHADSSRHDVIINKATFKDINGNVVGIVGAIQDITTRMQAEEALKESEERFKAQYHGSPTPTFTWQKMGDDFVLVGYNDAATVMTNGGVAQYIGKTAHEMYELQQDVLEDLGRCFEEKTIIRKELRSKHFLPGRFIITTYVFVPNDLVMVHVEDITDRKLAEEALRKSEERYRTIFENTGTASILMGEDTTILLANSKFQKLAGYSRQEIEGKMSWTSFVDKEDLERMRQYHELRRKEPESVPGSYEFRSINRYGEKRNIILNVALIPGTNESVASLMDITELKHSEEVLRESEMRFKAFMDVLPSLVILKDHNLRPIYFNKLYQELFPAEDWKGKTPDEIFPPEIADPMAENDRKALSDGFVQYEETWTDKDGKEHVYETRKFRIDRGELPSLLGAIITDVTERKLSEATLRQSEETARVLLNAPPLPAYLLNNEGQILALNMPGATVFGRQVNEMVGKNIFDMLPSQLSRERKARLDQAVLTGKPVRFEDERAGWSYDNILYPLINDQGNVEKIAVIAIDITERKRAEEEKKRLESQLNQVQKMEAIGTLAGGIAHDFNNILAAIIGYTELAMEDISQPAKMRSNLKEVLRASSRAKDLAKQILMFSRKTQIEYKPIVLRTVIKDSLKMLRSVIPSTIEIRENLIDSGLILSDPTQINQIIMNLSTNAVHAMDETGGMLEIRLKKVNINGDGEAQGLNLSPGPYLMISISDTGYGMSPEVLERIYEPYFTTKDMGRGTGLGMSVVHGIVHNHGGAITCKSAPGEGTTFDIYLPEFESKKEEVESLEETPLLTGTERILFIDDEPALVNIAEKMLSKLGYDVVTTTSSLDALAFFRARPDTFDLVITDMTMPGMTGDKLAHNLMEISHDIPIILCTGYSEHISEEEAKRIGIREFVMKPLEMKELARTIRKVLDQR
jgi:PAS domain S-box-containing protein